MELTDIKRKIIDKLLPGIIQTPDDIEAQYPSRNLPEGAMVTRVAPSPTGFMHIGGIYASMISERLAHQSGGVFYVRIEDTDKKREVEGALEIITSSFDNYGIKVDEGEMADGIEIGNYGPYTQSNRAEIYKVYVKNLLERGLAYPCFCSSEELDEMRQKQEEQSVRPGYYKEWAVWRNKTDEEVMQALEEGKRFVIRFKSDGSFENKTYVKDLLLGDREFPENDQDIVIMKSDGLPTYHMAHIIDDFLMKTTHAIRGNEWLSSVSLHIQMFKSMGWKAPRYGHIFPIQKMDGMSKRKLSKRKDPEANIVFYDEQGYPEEAVIEYLLNLANSNFEDWRKLNPDKDNREFEITFKKLASSNGPLFDFVKLDDISKEIVSRYSADKVFEKVFGWAKKYDHDLVNLMDTDSGYIKKILNIERGVESGKTRKDIAKWSEVKGELEYFFDDYFNFSKEDFLSRLDGMKGEDIKILVDAFVKVYNENDTKDEWFAKIKDIAAANGYAVNMKDFKNAPDAYKGSVADVAKVLRVLITGKAQTPDLHAIMQVMGRERVMKRLK